MFVTVVSTMTNNKKQRTDGFQKRTQTNPILAGKESSYPPSQKSMLRWVSLKQLHFGLKPLSLPLVYFLQAFSKSTSLIFASVQSHASTSANSSCLFLASLETSAVANSPISSMNHINVAGIPLSLSRFSYFFEISC